MVSRKGKWWSRVPHTLLSHCVEVSCAISIYVYVAYIGACTSIRRLLLSHEQVVVSIGGKGGAFELVFFGGEYECPVESCV